MHPRTEDLLSVRDGEPLDAATRARWLADPDAAAEIERLRVTRRALEALPELTPPPGVWEAIDARTRAASSPPRGRLVRWLTGVAIAASVAVAALLVIARAPAPLDLAPPTAIVGADPEPRPLLRPVIQPAYASLVEESVRLERMLAQLPQRRVIRAGTASTIAGLEDRISFIDAQLTLGAARGLPANHKQDLWRERVELMNALVHVRYAQAESGGF